MAESYVKEIGEYGELLKKFRKDAKLFAMENELLEIEQTRYKMLYHEVHQVQARKKTAESEEKIRELLRDVIMLDIPVVEAKVKRFGDTLEFLQNTKQKVADKDSQINNCYRFLQSWLELHEGFWALASFRSLEHFAQFMEMDITDENKKVWKHSLDPYNDGGYTGVNKPFFHYFNQMVMRKDIKFISKQYPTGVGKSFGNQVAIAWLLGVDKENDVLIVLGNPALVSINANGIIGIMTNPRFAKVFPEYAQYFEDGNVSDRMFSICRVKQGELCLEGTTRPMNVHISMRRSGKISHSRIDQKSFSDSILYTTVSPSGSCALSSLKVFSGSKLGVTEKKKCGDFFGTAPPNFSAYLSSLSGRMVTLPSYVFFMNVISLMSPASHCASTSGHSSFCGFAPP